MNQLKLIAKIEKFEIDPPESRGAFATRLASEQNWSPYFTDRVIHEYKRFVALAMISEREVTPSKTVDEAWHLHLIFTDSYWNRMTKILPKALHHHPGVGGKSDRLKYKEQFRYTLDLYRTTFGTDAPADVWGARLPPPKTNFWKANQVLVGVVIGGIALAGLVAIGAVLWGLIAFGTIAVACALNAFATQFPISVPHYDQRRIAGSASTATGGCGSCGTTGCGSAKCGDTGGAGCGSDSGGGDSSSSDSGGDGGGGCGGGGD